MTLLSTMTLDLTDEAATTAFGVRLAGLARPRDVIALQGDLGMGKSTLARAFIIALAPDAGDVPSPTFTLVQTYETALAPVWHVDAYRLEDPDDAVELGLEEAFEDGILLIEWPGKLGPYLPHHRLDLTLRQGAVIGARIAELCDVGGSDWLKRLAVEVPP